MKPLAALAKGICLFCAIFAAQAMAFADVAERTAPLPPAEVLIINSFHSGHFWEYNIIKRISEELENTETGFRIRLHCEYLDYERHPPGSLDNELVSLFARKYAGVSLKAIIVTDNDALDFMLAHGNRLFPGVPVVFCGIADPPAELAERRAHYTGILENFSIHRILESIPLVHPEARHLAIICGDTTSARTALRQAAPELAAMKPGIAVRTLAALPAQAMQKALEELPRDTVLLNFGYYRTADGQSYSMKESLQQLRSWTDLPMYSPWSGQLGKGVLAGQCEFNEFHAVHAARMVLSVLGGTLLRPVTSKTWQIRWTFLWKQNSSIRQFISTPSPGLLFFCGIWSTTPVDMRSSFSGVRTLAFLPYRSRNSPYLQNQPLLSHSSILIRLRRILSQRNLPTLPQNISLAELRCFMVPKMWEKVMLCLVLPIV